MLDDDSGSDTAPNPKDLRIEQLRGLLARIDAEHDEQRGMLARELHHKVVGSLSAAKMECDWLLRAPRAADVLRPRLERLSAELVETIQFTRRMIGALWPAIVTHLGLASAIQQQLADVRGRCSASIDLEVDGDADGITGAPAIVLYRLAEQVLAACEAESPKVGHARLVLHRMGPQVHMTAELDAALPRDDKWLLIEERVARMDGSFAWEHTSSGATLIDVMLPAAM
jgi:signal transduction histidine kinase